MFKVMIADDSPYVLQYLCNLIDWESFDFILTGSYTNAHGLLAAAKKTCRMLLLLILPCL